ncbi:class II fructose-bisphosphatase [Methylocystis sp. B8]|uniref:class II fructose-bisphosphatase n=1 Tax=Methylocystis sp. B8 TaxID=544938 RepID=UPI0010FEF9A9|nr:class II fructose-bisphosphatase [Methylocystis sp. B8]TLG72804.1 class II fructose-bisphosphatase [Methylocystis sp. B8]
MTQQSETDASQIDRYLTLELARASERAAVAAARLRGRGDEMAADLAAAEAMREELSRLPVRGRVVIGEGDEDAAPLLYVGEEIGAGIGPRVDLGVAALEGSTLCAKDMPGSISVAAMAPAGSLLHAPDVYMDKIAIGPGYPEGTIDLDRDPGDNVRALAIAKGVRPSEITVSILDRPRHAEIIKKCRNAGACVRLITDGDVAAIILTTHPSETGVDMYLGRGGAAEGVLAACVLRCAGGQMQGRLALENRDQIAQAQRFGLLDPRRKYSVGDMAAGDVVVCVTGVTAGPLVGGVSLGQTTIDTETIVYRSATGTIRRIHAMHRVAGKFD